MLHNSTKENVLSETPELYEWKFLNRILNLLEKKRNLGEDKDVKIISNPNELLTKVVIQLQLLNHRMQQRIARQNEAEELALERDAEVIELVGASDDDDLGQVGDVGGVNAEWRALLLGSGVDENETDLNEDDENVRDLDEILGFSFGEQKVLDAQKPNKSKKVDECPRDVCYQSLQDYVSVVGECLALGNNLYIPRIHQLFMPKWVEKEKNTFDLSKEDEEVKDEDKKDINVHDAYNILTESKYHPDVHSSFLFTTNVVYLHRTTRLNAGGPAPFSPSTKSDVSPQKTSLKLNSSLLSPQLHPTHAVDVTPVQYSMFFYYLLLPLYKKYYPSFVPIFTLVVALNLVFEIIMRKYSLFLYLYNSFLLGKLFWKHSMRRD
jgi:hypothetical protein